LDGASFGSNSLEAKQLRMCLLSKRELRFKDKSHKSKTAACL
jgi:hypothetical protein